MMRLGVDTGGTFTDFVTVGADGRLHIHKQLSTPADPSRAILSGIATLQIPDTTPVVHGSTVATNALLERRGARAALVTTAGFADLLAIGRQNRPDLYALVPQKPPPLIPKAWRFTVPERVSAAGEPLQPLDPAALPPLIAALQAEKIESVAVCLLFSFLYPAHERQIAAALQEALPEVELSLSVDILPEYREYERTATTVINAYVAPLMRRYLGRLQREVRPRPLTIMQSNGGVISADTAAAAAARTALSGPAGGVVGAHFVAAQAGFPQIITFDMGGTSTDVALCPGRLPTTTRGEIAGLPLRLPIIDIHTVGAGGGSLGHVDAGGALHVGPESAGADPGPACYGRPPGARNLPPDGRATVTDANLLLGRLDADHFLGGAMTLDVDAARDALTALANRMGADSVEEAAWGVLQLANANMERAIRKISVERGYDPRDFTLVPFGGAGPLHACELAAQLGIPRVLIPPTPGVLSALGMLVAPPAKDYSQTIMGPLDPDEPLPAAFTAAREAMQTRARVEMAAEGHTAAAITLQEAVDMRYRGQSHELQLPYAGADSGPDRRLPRRAHSAVRVCAGGGGGGVGDGAGDGRCPRRSPPVAAHRPAHRATNRRPPSSAANRSGSTKDPIPTPVIDRDRLLPGQQFPGPALLFQYTTPPSSSRRAGPSPSTPIITSSFRRSRGRSPRNPTRECARPTAAFHHTRHHHSAK
jgi:N-methylhydantoinase A